MNDLITDALGNQWAMFYIDKKSCDDLTPMQTLDKSINLVNQSLTNQGRNIANWDLGMQDEITRLLWVNWIYQRLKFEPIRKPILTHYEHGNFYVDCGDTRLMSLKLFDCQSDVSVITTCNLDSVKNFTNWQRIYNTDDLKKCAGFGPDAVVLATPAVDWCLYWLEIGDQHTSHHLHSIDQRMLMIQNYINQQTKDFTFSVDWAKTPIDWAIYQSTE